MSDKLERKDTDKTQIDWNEHAAYWDDFDEAHEYTKHIIRLVDETIDVSGLKILDFGCGTGLLIDYLQTKANKVVGLDTSDKMIEKLQSKGYSNVTAIAGELSQSTIEKFPALQQSFDLIVAVSVCTFLPNYDEVLAHFKSLLKPGGTYIQWDWLAEGENPDFGFTKEDMSSHITKAGFSLQSINTPFYMMENEEQMHVLMAIANKPE